MRLGVLFLALILAAIAFYSVQFHEAHTRSYGEAKIGGAFTLTDKQGDKISDKRFRGRIMLVYMGYSRCPDICPMALATMSEALKMLGSDADNVAPIFITLDPERDTPQTLARFLKPFDPRIIGLTGNAQEIKNTADAYKLAYSRMAAPANGSYLIGHSGFLYIMDRQGKYVRHVDSEVKPANLADALRALF